MDLCQAPSIAIPDRRTVPRCDAIVDLISLFERPYRFRVTVQGQPPHAQRRVYEIVAVSDADAAKAGIDRFCREMSSTLRIVAGLDRALGEM